MTGTFILFTFLGCLGLITGKATLKSDSVAETPCGKYVPATNLQADWISKIPAWFVQMGSAHYFHTWVERLTNQSGGTEQIANLCLKLMFLAADKPNSPYMVVAGGLGKAVTYKCKAEGPHQQICDGVLGSPNYKPGPESEDTLVMTDNKHYTLFFRCTHGKIKSWFVLTPSTVDLSQEVKKEALLFAVKNGGFDKKYGSMISYAKCPAPKVKPPTGDSLLAGITGGLGNTVGGVLGGVSKTVG